MNWEKLTTKSQEALMKAQTIAQQKGHQSIDAAHLALGMIETDFLQDLLKQMQIDYTKLKDGLTDILDKIPSVSGASSQVYVSQDLNRILMQAEQEAKDLNDEFISLEHLLLALCAVENPVKDILKREGIFLLVFCATQVLASFLAESVLRAKSTSKNCPSKY